MLTSISVREAQIWVLALLVADIDTARGALILGGIADPFARSHIYLNGNAGETRHAYACVLAVQGREAITTFGITRSLTRVAERCSPAVGSGQAFTNTYWIDNAGVAWSSIQYVSANAGPIRIEYVLRD